MEPAAKDNNSDVLELGEVSQFPDLATFRDADPNDKIAEPKPVPEGAPPLADDPPYYAGLWNDIPLFGCPYCPFTALATHGGPGTVELHILSQIDRGSKAHEAALELMKED